MCSYAGAGRHVLAHAYACAHTHAYTEKKLISKKNRRFRKKNCPAGALHPVMVSNWVVVCPGPLFCLMRININIRQDMNNQLKNRRTSFLPCITYFGIPILPPLLYKKNRVK